MRTIIVAVRARVFLASQVIILLHGLDFRIFGFFSQFAGNRIRVKKETSLESMTQRKLKKIRKQIAPKLFILRNASSGNDWGSGRRLKFSILFMSNMPTGPGFAQAVGMKRMRRTANIMRLFQGYGGYVKEWEWAVNLKWARLLNFIEVWYLGRGAAIVQ